MLCLKRRRMSHTFIEVPPSETPTTIEIVINECGLWGVKLGIIAPREVEIAREEAIKQVPSC
jgi:sRNA-binding carbon storage regulator CsrA